MSITPRLAALAVPLLLVGGALTGCGVSDGPQVRPGVAAEVDGTTIELSDVDDTVAGTCAYLDDADGALPFPRVTVRRLLVETLVRETAAERLLDELDAELPDTYAPAVASIDQNYADAPDDQAAAMRAGDTSSTYVALASDAIGNTLLREETGAEPGNPEEIRARGTQAIADWLADHDVDLNPTYGLRIDDGSFVADDGLSVPVSDGAVFNQGVAGFDISGQDEELQTKIQQASAQLSDDQVCGTRTAG
ncbi:hypothetical protein [Nocardioides sp.]|uniref:hypothetical protein n=1 Tax=Nocardioides sp. TaxID=35761 RepID=UPI002725BF33|nr:hypothetical protein [Nocardioides sp.]MDO9454707.1 hypothetical protein [Nocardioides sp.]